MKAIRTLPLAAAFLLSLSGPALTQTSGGTGGSSGGASSTGAGIGASGLTGSNAGVVASRRLGYRNHQSRHVGHRHHCSRHGDHRPGCGRKRRRQRRSGVTLPSGHNRRRRRRGAPLPSATGDDRDQFQRDFCATVHHGAPEHFGRALAPG